MTDAGAIEFARDPVHREAGNWIVHIFERNEVISVDFSNDDVPVVTRQILEE